MHYNNESQQRGFVHIKEAINRAVLPYHQTSYVGLEKITRSSHLKITWWGSRRVYSTDPNYTGYIPLYELLDRAIWLVKQNIEFDMKERRYGEAIYTKIGNMMYEEQEYKKKCSLITKIFQTIVCAFTYLDVKSYNFLNPVSIWNFGHECDRFSQYTRNQYKLAFGVEPVEKGYTFINWQPNEPEYWIN